MTNAWKSLAPQFLSLLRIAVSAMFVLSGTSKLFAFPVGMPPDGSTADLMTQTGIGGILETFGGGLVLIGLFTRPVAFVLSGMMAVAYWQFHFKPDSPYPTVNGGMAAVALCFVFLYLSAAGPGPWSLDALLSKKRRT